MNHRLALITELDSVYENKTNKQLSAEEEERNKADVEGSWTPPPPRGPEASLSPWKATRAGSSQRVTTKGPELQPAMINNQPQNMSAPLICSCRLKSRPADLIPRMDANLKQHLSLIHYSSGSRERELLMNSRGQMDTTVVFFTLV